MGGVLAKHLEALGTISSSLKKLLNKIKNKSTNVSLLLLKGAILTVAHF